MNKKRSLLFLLSVTYVGSIVGYSAWVHDYNYSYSQSNKVQSIPVAYIVGKESVKYTTIEKALDVAKNGDIVCVIPPTNDNYHSSSNNITPDKVTYEITRDCEIKEGVTLVLPTDKSSFSNVTNASTLNTYLDSLAIDSRDKGGNYGLEANSNESKYLRVTVKIRDGVTLKNNGNLVISGYLGGGNNNSGMVGQTTHSYSQIILGSRAKIQQNNTNSNLYCYGYIREETNNNLSSIEILNGNLYLPLIIFDYRGFPFSYSLTNGALSNNHCSPFNQFGVKNIEAKTTLAYSSKTYGVSNLYLNYSSMGVDKNFNNVIGLVGNTSSFFIQFNDPTFSSLMTRIDKASNLFSMDIYGGCILNNINLELRATSTLTVNLSTTDSFLPISYRHRISLNCAAGQNTSKYDLTKQRIKLLPEATLSINENCNVTSTEFIVYTAFFDGTLGNGKNISNAYNGVKYPLKKGATMIVSDNSSLSATSLGGQIYCDNSNNISYSANTVISKEAWNIKTGSGLNPWLTDNYLEIREKLNISPCSYLNKQKLFCGVNTFASTNSYLPNYIIQINDGETIVSIDTFQKVVFLDTITNYSLDFVSNIYKVLHNTTYYEKNEIIPYSDTNSIMCAINSDIAISNNNNGINEFNAQSVSISCTTPLIDGNIPLYPGSSIQLEATIIDFDKVYDKKITWTSSDTSIATIDQTGKVTGVSLGEVTFTATCDGVSGSFTANVISSVEIIPITKITITESKGKSVELDTTVSTSKSIKLNETSQYSNNTDVTFTLSLNEGAKWSSIEWEFRPSQKGRQYLTDKTLESETVSNTESVTIHVVSGSGKDDDAFTLNCSVVDLSNGKTYKINMTLYHKADMCFEMGTLITTNKGPIPVEKLSSTDLIKSFNHETGCYEFKPIAALINHGEKIYKVIQLIFSDKSTIGFITCHGLFDLNLNKYVNIDEKNVFSFIGHRFAKSLGLNKKIIILLDAKIVQKRTSSYTVLSSQNINCEANGILNITSVLKGIYNIFDYDENQLFDSEKMAKDITKHGLLSYADCSKIIDRKKYNDLGFKYFKISIEKGILTKEDLQYYIEWFFSCIANGEAEIY